VQILVAWWVACVLWSSTFLFIKAGLADVPPLTFAWVRLVLALCLLVPITLGKRGFEGLASASIAKIAAAGALLLGVNYGLLYWGAQRIPSGLVAILQSGTPLFALLMGWLAGSERVSFRKLIALAGGCAGVVLIFGAEASVTGPGGLAGAVMVLASSACVAFAYVWLKGRQIRANPLTVTTIQCLAGVLLLAPAALLTEGSPLDAAWSPTSVLAVMYLAVGASVVAFGLNYWLLSRIDASAMLMMGIAEVPIAIALGAVILGERLPPGTFAGAACVLAAVMLTSLRSEKVPPPPAPPTTRR
jgi:drug/metabolite transporter (DMT)-like permease